VIQIQVIFTQTITNVKISVGQADVFDSEISPYLSDFVVGCDLLVPSYDLNKRLES
jgi:hypothetical protein